MTLAQLINNMKEENRNWETTGEVFYEYFTFEDETDLYQMNISCDGEFLQTDFVYKLENGVYTFDESDCQVPEYEDLEKNLNREIVLQKPEFIEWY